MAADMLTTATWLVEQRGFSIVALHHPGDDTITDPKRIGKVPVTKWQAFQRARPTSDNLRSWFGNGTPRNLGIVTGAVSQLVAVDCDSPEAVAWADAHLPPTPMATRTSRGEHRFYAHPGVPVRNAARLQTGDDAVQLDVRGDGGYTVAPGSVHASGVVYERVGSWPPVTELPVFDPAWLAPETATPSPAPARAQTPAARTPETTREDVLTRADAYLRATPPAIQGQGGDAHTFQVCCRLVRGFDLADADALEILRAWNAGCVPPWSDRELVAKIAGARRYGDEPVGGRRDDPQHARRTAASSQGSHRMSPPALAPGAPETVSPDFSVFHTTDSGNAEMFAARHGDDLRFDHRRGRWLVWSAHHWQPDADAEVRRRAKDAMRARLQAATVVSDDDKRKRAVKWALDSEGRSRLDALAYLAQAEPPIADPGTDWDRDPWLLCTPAGVVDLRTGSLRPGQRADRITMATRVPFDPQARCPRWERFIAEVFAADADVIAFIHRAVGYSLTGDTAEQCLFMPYGTGANGKSTLLKTLMAVLGDYGDNMPFSTIEMHQRAAIPNDLAALVGRRFVVAAETNDGTRLNEARIKALTGCDPITARFLHGEFFTFEPVAKFWLSVNHKPVVRDDSHGFWRRIRLIPFTQTFPVTATLADELRAELPGILTWAVRGCLAWQQDGLHPPAAVVAATDTYARDSDPLANFLEEACALEAGSQVGAGDLFEHYRRWADTHQLTDRERLSATAFGRKVSERFTHDRTRAGKVYVGLARRPL